MIGKVLKFIGWENKIDLSLSGIDDLKIVAILFGVFIGIVVGLVFPWLYGILQIGLLIFK